MKLRKMILLCITACCAALLLSACSSLIRQDNKQSGPVQPTLSEEDIMKMSPEELKQYHAKKAQERERQWEMQERKQDPRAKSLVESFSTGRPSQEKRKRLGDVSRQLEPDQHPSVFPWRAPSEQRRSETLLRDRTY